MSSDRSTSRRSRALASAVAIGSTRAVRVFAYSAPVDMRKSYNGLEGLVRNEMGHDLMRGDMYLFTGKDRRRAKVLLFDGTGLCIYLKKLSLGQFAKLRAPSPHSRHSQTVREIGATSARCKLGRLLDGTKLVVI
jgi:transposase